MAGYLVCWGLVSPSLRWIQGKVTKVCEGLLVGLHVLSSKTYKPDETRHIQDFIEVAVLRPGFPLSMAMDESNCLGFAGFRLLVLLVAYRIEVSRSSTCDGIHDVSVQKHWP